MQSIQLIVLRLIAVVLLLLTVTVGIWYFLGPAKVALSKMGITHQTRRKIFWLLALFLLAVPLYAIIDILLPCPGLSPVNYIPSLPVSPIEDLFIRTTVVLFLLPSLFARIALLVTPRSWSREKMGWILFLMAVISIVSEPLLIMKLTNVWHPEDLARLSMYFTDVGFALFLSVLTMFLLRSKKKEFRKEFQEYNTLVKETDTLLPAPPRRTEIKTGVLSRVDMLLHYIGMIFIGINPFTIMKARRLFEKYGYEIGLANLEACYLTLGGSPSFDEFIAIAQIIFERKETMDFKKLFTLHLAGHTDKIKEGKTLAEIIKEAKRAQEEDAKQKGL
jgi:hypothetical protein